MCSLHATDLYLRWINLKILRGLSSLAVIAWVFFAISGVSAFGADADDAASHIQDVVTRKINEAIGPFIPAGKFTVQVVVVAKESPRGDANDTSGASLYLRRNGGAPLPVDLNKKTIEKLADSIKVTIGLPPSLSKAQQMEISEILKNVLPTNASISFKKSMLAQPDDTKDQNLLRADNELRNTKNRLEDLKKERDDVKRESELAKTEAEKLARENTVLKTKSAKNPTLTETLQAQVGSILGYILVFVAMIVIGIAIMRIASGIIGSVSGLANAVQNAAATLANAHMNTASQVTLDAPQTPKEIGSGTSQGSATGTQLTSGISERIAELKMELEDLVTNEKLELTGQFISDLLANPSNGAKAVLVFELIGRDRAAKIFQGIPQENQIQILGFMREAKYPTNKFELMIQAGEELKTKIVLENLKLPESTETGAVLQSLKHLTTDQLGGVLLGIQLDALPRLFSIIDAKAASDLLVKVRSQNEKRFQDCVVALSKLPEARFSPEQATRFDPEIYRSIKHLTQESRSEVFKPFLKHYEEILESMPDDVSDDFLVNLKHEPELTKYHTANIITLATIFKIVPSQAKDIIDSLSNKDIAAVLFGLNDIDRLKIREFLDDMRKDLVQEEFERIEGQGKLKAERQFKASKSKVITILKNLNVNGELQFEAITEVQSAA